MADILTNPVDICFCFMPAESTALAACLVIESTAITSNQQVKSDLLAETHSPTRRDLIPGLDHVKDMLSDMVKVYERVKRPRRTTPPSPPMPLDLWNTAHAVYRHMKKKILIESGSNSPSHGNRRGHLDDTCPVHKNSKHMAR
jgi:hypothetical protein